MINNTNPLLPNYPFNFELVAGITKIKTGNMLDFVIDRPNGMNGYILHLTTSGKGEVFDGEKRFVAEKGQLLLFSPEAIHHYYRESLSSHWYHKWIYFYPNSKWIDWLTWSNTINYIGRIKIQDIATFNELSRTFTKIEIELNSNTKLSQQSSSSLLEYLLIKCKSFEDYQAKPSIDERVLQVCNLISKNLAMPISIPQLADIVYLSPSRLSHLFTKQMRMSILQWRDSQRIIEAKKQLYLSNISISGLAKLLGYDDPLYFSKIFKKYVGLSPSEFRNTKQK